MFKALTKILTLALVLFQALPSIASNIKVEAKEFDNQTAIIFYHDRWTPLTASVLGHHGRIRASKELHLNIQSSLLDKICTGLAVSAGKNTIDFKLKAPYRFVSTVYGENLIAFKIQGLEKPEEKPELVKDIKIEDKAAVDKTQTKLSDVTVQMNDSKSSKQLTFPFKEQDVGAAIFSRGTDLWVIFDSRKDFYLPDSSFIESWAQYSDIHNTIMKIKLKKNLEAVALKQGNSWVIKFVPKAPSTKQSLNPELVSDILVSVKQMDGAKNIITIRDPDVGDLLVAVPLPKAGFGVQKERTMVDYQILPSVQGVAISLVSEDVKVAYNDNAKSIEIASHYTMPNAGSEEVKAIQDNQTILPPVPSDVDNASFLQIKQSLLDALIHATDNASQTKAKLDLAKFYFANGMYQESLGMITLAEKTKSDQLTAPTALFTKALDLVFTNQSLDARAVFIELKNHYANTAAIGEINLWDRYNEYLLGNIPESIGIFGNKLLNSYSAELYWKLVFAELEIHLAHKNFKSMDALLGSVQQSQDISINNNLKYYRAQYYYLQNQYNLAEHLLVEVKDNAQNGREYTMADLQLVKMLYEQKKMDWISAVQRLNQLRFVWRGDNLEMKLLLSLALAYKQNDDIVNAIRTYKYIVEAFGRQSDNNFFITSQIVELYNRIFVSDELNELDDFTVVALFYEFKEYTPIGAEGDRVVLGIARRMLNLDLLDMAIEVLEHQVMYRLRGVERMVTANHLALVLLMDKKPAEALKILNDTDNENFGISEHQKRRYLKAKALIDMKKYDEALLYIGDDVNEDAFVLKTEALFRGHKWADYIKLIEVALKQKIADGAVIKGEETQDVLRLAISYSMLNRISDLEYLQKHIVTESKDLKSVIEFLRNTNTPIDPHNIDKSLNIDQMKHFIDKQVQQLFN